MEPFAAVTAGKGIEEREGRAATPGLFICPSRSQVSISHRSEFYGHAAMEAGVTIYS
jgi:hypothetical protein